MSHLRFVRGLYRFGYARKKVEKIEEVIDVFVQMYLEHIRIKNNSRGQYMIHISYSTCKVVHVFVEKNSLCGFTN
jgi:hypothetical protein